MAPTPRDIAEQARASKRAQEIELARRMRAAENFVPVDYTVAGNARITVTAVGRTGKPSRSAVAVALRKAAS